MRVLVHQDRRLTVRILTDELNINRDTVRKIVVEDLCTKKLCEKIISTNLSEEQKQDCLEQVKNNPILLKRVITGDGSWLHQ